MGDENLYKMYPFFNLRMSTSTASNIEIPFPSKRTAQIAFDVLRVDKEPPRSHVTKVLSVRENILVANFSAKLATQARVAISGFFQKLDLIIETVEIFGPPTSENYSHY